MITDIAIPEEPEDRCVQCKGTFQFHVENPGGVRYLVPKEPTYAWLTEEVEVTSATYDIRVCYVYKIHVPGMGIQSWKGNSN